MNKSIHTPERLQGESQAAYRERRLASKSAVELMTLTGRFTPGSETSRQALRNSQRKSGAMKKIAGRYGRGLSNWRNGKPSAARV